MATQYANGQIVTNGLVLALNAADKNSYPGSGTTWFDTSGNGYNGTLTNGPTFNSGNGGTIVFDGVDDYVIEASISSLFTGNITVEAWIKVNASPSDWVRIVGTGGNSGNRTFGLWYATDRRILWQRYGASDPSILPSSPVLNIGSWYQVVATTSGSSHVLYLNTTSIGTATAAGPWAASGEAITIGFAGFHTYTNSNIAAVRLYTRGLSAQEVLQNYNATKTRFGL